MNISTNGLNLIAEFEGFVDHLYNDPAGHCTIGIGHLLHRGNCNGHPIEEAWHGGITYSTAIHLLNKDVERYVDAVNQAVRVPLNQNQFDALVSFTFNLGQAALARSILLTVLNQGYYNRVCDELKKWNKARVNSELVVLPGLTRRRQAECDLWVAPVQLPGEGEELLSREYEEVKESIRREHDRVTFLAEVAVGVKGALAFFGTVIKELVKRTGGPGVQ